MTRTLRILPACLLAALVGPAQALGDHGPLTCSYSDARSRSEAAESPPAEALRWLGRSLLGSDSLASHKLAELLCGPLMTGIASFAVQWEEILDERYGREDARNLSPAWCMTGSLVSLTAGHALYAGEIDKLDDPAVRCVPEVCNTGWGRTTVREVLQMHSGSSRQDLTAGDDYLYASMNSGLDRVNGVLSAREIRRRFQRHSESSVLVAARRELPSVFHPNRAGYPVTHGYSSASLRDFARWGLYLPDVHRGWADTPCLQEFARQALTPYTEGIKSVDRQPVSHGFKFWLDAGAGPSSLEAVRISGPQVQDIFVNLRTVKVVIVPGWRASLRHQSHQPGSVPA